MKRLMHFFFSVFLVVFPLLAVSATDCLPPKAELGLEPVQAEVLHVNAPDGLVTLRHATVSSLGISGAVGTYQVTDDALLPALSVGARGWVTLIRRKTQLALVQWHTDPCLDSGVGRPTSLKNR